MSIYAEKSGFRTTSAERYVYNTTHERRYVDQPEYFSKEGQGHLPGLIGLPFQVNCWDGGMFESDFHTATFIVHSLDKSQRAHVVRITPWHPVTGPAVEEPSADDDRKVFYVPEDCIVKDAGLFYNVVGEKSGDQYASIKKTQFGEKKAKQIAFEIATGVIDLECREPSAGDWENAA